MPIPPVRLLEILRLAGVDLAGGPPPPEVLRQADEAVRLIAEQPDRAAAQMLRALRSAAAAEKLKELFAQLLETDAILGRLEHLYRDRNGRLRAICRIAGQVRDLAVHPDVPEEDLSSLAPWEYVSVHSKEMLVVGTHRQGDLFHRAHGPVVEFKGYHDRPAGLVRVARQGHDEEIVTLSQPLRERELKAPIRLVLHREIDNLAIATVSADAPQSRFEVDIRNIDTRLEDLAGMESVIEPMIEDILMCLVHPEIREQFGLRPLRGMLLYSYKPGVGKTSLMRALAQWLFELGAELDFEVILYIVKPNELKIVWHGGDAKLVREDLCGSILARQALPRTRPLFQLVVMDEVDSLGKRAGGDDRVGLLSAAQNDAVQALLVEMDGMIQQKQAPGSPPAHVLWVGLTNRPDMLDDALKRPGRFGDLVLEVPAAGREGAEGILAIYARGASVPWHEDGEVRAGLSEDEIRSRFLRPALARVFDEVVLRYQTEQRKGIEVRAGEVLAGVHYKEAMNCARKRAGKRRLLETGVPAIDVEDIVSSLLEQALSAARQMEGDRQMLSRQLRIKTAVTGIEVVPEEELSDHIFVRTLVG